MPLYGVIHDMVIRVGNIDEWNSAPRTWEDRNSGETVFNIGIGSQPTLVKIIPAVTVGIGDPRVAVIELEDVAIACREWSHFPEVITAHEKPVSIGDVVRLSRGPAG